ncbi:hypothetical protein BDR22DRAFT_919378 [Usnea florida]
MKVQKSNHCIRRIFITSCTSALFTLPDPYLPPPNCDNTSLWQEIMAKRKPLNADTSQYTASSYGAKGTAGYGNLLAMITGNELPKIPDYYVEGPSTHFDEILGNIQKVEQYVTTFDQPTAETFIQDFQCWYQPSLYKHCPRSESDLVHYLSRHFFTERQQLRNSSQYSVLSQQSILPCDQGAVKERAECSSRFHRYSIPELRESSSIIRSIRMAQEDRLLASRRI